MNHFKHIHIFTYYVRSSQLGSVALQQFVWQGEWLQRRTWNGRGFGMAVTALCVYAFLGSILKTPYYEPKCLFREKLDSNTTS